jgi:hypothetical protein
MTPDPDLGSVLIVQTPSLNTGDVYFITINYETTSEA